MEFVIVITPMGNQIAGDYQTWLKAGRWNMETI